MINPKLLTGTILDCNFGIMPAFNLYYNRRVRFSSPKDENVNEEVLKSLEEYSNKALKSLELLKNKGDK